MKPTTSNSRKVLVPLATLLAAGAIAVGSGATFTTQSTNSVSAVTSGTLKQSNSKAGTAVFNLSNIKPGDTLNGTVTIKNTGSLAQSFKLSETMGADGFTPGVVLLKLTDQASPGTPLYSGALEGLPSIQLPATAGGNLWAADESHTYQFSVTLPSTAGITEQGKTAEASFTWDGTQDTSGTTTNQ